MSLFRSLLLPVVLAVLLSSSAYAHKKDKPDVKSTHRNVVDVKLNLVAFVTGGLVVGDAADLIELYSDERVDKSLYGFGASLCYYPYPRFGVALGLERAYKVVPGDDVDPGQGWFYSTSLIYNLRTLAREIPYLRFDVGFVSAMYPLDGPDIELGTHFFIRAGVGFFGYTSGKTNLRFELYYVRAFTEGSRFGDFRDFYVDFYAECVGIEFGVGVPLLSR